MCSLSSIWVARPMGSETLPSAVRSRLGRVYHGCWRTWGKPKRRAGSTDMTPRSRERASGGTRAQRASVLWPAVRTYSPNSQLPAEGSSQGVLPTRRTKRMTPQDHRSAASAEYLAAASAEQASARPQARISGAM
ncbi:hypothetical protein CDD83_1334 [Cordyceps sp. RAO-2017]|nr:hypothetical protein CDD83_1334 [Cordyceps sp. RAO-2017]